MRLKKIMLVTLLILTVLSISAVSANDNNITDNGGVLEYTSGETEISDDNIVLSSQETDNGTFAELQSKIDNAEEGSTITLANNYAYEESFSSEGIMITKAITIDGNGYTIDGGSARAFYLKDGTVTIKNLSIINCWAQYGGGAIYNYHSANCTIDSCNFTNCYSDVFGGAISNYGNENMKVISCNFNKCTANEYGGAIENNGDGFNFLVKSCNFTDCSVQERGGAITNLCYNFTVDSCNFVKCTTVEYGQAGYAGAIENRCSDLHVTSCNFTDCWSNYGGAIYNYDKAESCYITSCNFNNCSTIAGGVVYNEGDNVNCNVTSCNFINCTVNEKSAAIYNKGSNCTATTCKFTNVNESEAGYNVEFINCTFNYTPSTVLTASNVTATYGVSKNLTVTLEDANGNVLESKNITINVGSISKTLITDSKGQASVDVSTLIPKTYIATIKFKGDESYTASNQSVSVVVKKAPSSIILEENITAVYGNVIVTEATCVNATGISAKIYDEDGSEVHATLKIEGFTINVLDIDAGNYTLNVTTITDDNHTVSSNTSSIIINKADITLILANASDINPTESEIIGVELSDLNINGNLTYTFGETTYAVENYTIILSNLTESNYTVLVELINDTNYNYASNYTNFVVRKVNYNITVKSEDVMVNETAYVVVSLPGDATGNVSVTVNNDTRVIPINSSNVHGLNGVLSMVVTYDNLSAGDYDVVAVYNGNDKYNSSSATSNFTVSKFDYDISVVSDDVMVNETAYVVVSLPGDATGNVTITVNNDTQVVPINDSTVYGLNGVLSMVVTYDNLSAGDYNVTAVYNGNDKYNSSSATANFTVSKFDYDITVVSDDVMVNETAYVVVSLPGDATGNVTITVNNDTQVVPINDSTVYGLNGVLSMVVTYNNLSAGNYNVTAVYNGDDKYNPSSATANFTVSKYDDYSVDLDYENKTIVVTLPEDATGNVTVVIGNNTYSGEIDNGSVIIDVSDLYKGNYTATVYYPGDDKYGEYTGNFNISVPSNFNLTAPSVVKYYHGSERLYVYLLDGKENPISNASVSIIINGVTNIKTTDENGTASIAINLGAGEYDVLVTYNGTEQLSVNTSVTVKTTVNGTDVFKVFKNGTQYYATFRDSEGNYLADGTAVQFNINGVLYDRKVSGNEGLARLNINLAAGEYILTAINPVNGEMSSNNITVFSRLIENRNITKYFKNDTQYTVKVISDDGKAVGAGENITFNINGVFYTRQTDENGTAKLNINLAPGNYIITAEYEGCKVSNSIEVLPVLSASDLTKTYGTSDQFVATLLDGQGKAYGNQIVQFNINGVLYNRTTDSSGQAKLNINLMPGEYIITSSYNGMNIANTVKVNS